MKLSFGKYKDIEIRDVPHDYLHWMAKTITTLPATVYNEITDTLFPGRDWNSDYDEVIGQHRNRYIFFDTARFSKRYKKTQMRRIVMNGHDYIVALNKNRRKCEAMTRLANAHEWE